MFTENLTIFSRNFKDAVIVLQKFNILEILRRLSPENF